MKFAISFGEFIYNEKTQDMDYKTEKTVLKEYKNLDELLKVEKFTDYEFSDDTKGVYELINVKDEEKRIMIHENDSAYR